MSNKARGVTLVELLIVIVILGIIAAVAIPSVGMIVRNYQNEVYIQDVKAIDRAINLRNLANMAEEVPQPDGNTKDLTNEEWERYSDEIFGEYIEGSWPRNPFGGYYIYRYYEFGDGLYEHDERWTKIDSVDDEIILENNTISNIYNPTNYLEVIMVRFDDCDSTRRAANMLLDSDYAEYVFQYKSNSCGTVGCCDEGQNNLAIYISSD